jgi:hypothetical protein
MHVLHRCDVRLCINVEHLFLGTHAENIADAVAKGRMARGESHPKARLTDDQVTDIRAEPRTWGSSRRLARKYGVSESSISQIRDGLSRARPSRQA